MNTKKASVEILFMKKLTIKVDSAIISSDDDETLGAYCPSCGKPEIVSMEIAHDFFTGNIEDMASKSVGSLNMCTCKSCSSFWLLLIKHVGGRTLLCRNSQIKDIVDRIDVNGIIG